MSSYTALDVSVTSNGCTICSLVCFNRWQRAAEISPPAGQVRLAALMLTVGVDPAAALVNLHMVTRERVTSMQLLLDKRVGATTVLGVVRANGRIRHHFRCFFFPDAPDLWSSFCSFVRQHWCDLYLHALLAIQQLNQGRYTVIGKMWWWGSRIEKSTSKCF